MVTNKSILIVDDESGVRQALTRAIHRKFNQQEKNIHIHQAVNGQEAIEVAKEINPDLIIMDIRMPVMDGLAACASLRANSSFEKTLIFLLTCEIVSESEGLSSGADDYIIKPFDIHALLLRIKHGLQNVSRLQSPCYDHHTGLVHREYFLNERLDNEIARATRNQQGLSLMLLQITGFTHNQSLNSQLKELIDQIAIRKSDIAVRWHKDTIALLLPETNEQGAIIFAQKLQTKLATQFSHLTSHIGISILRQRETEQFVSMAQSSLLRAQLSKKITINGDSISTQ